MHVQRITLADTSLEWAGSDEELGMLKAAQRATTPIITSPTPVRLCDWCACATGVSPDNAHGPGGQRGQYGLEP